MDGANIQFPLVLKDYSTGWIADRDAFKVPLGGLTDGYNVDILPSGSIRTAPQYKLVGTSGGVGSSPITSSGLFKTRDNSSIEVYHAGTALYYWNTKTEDYATLRTGLSDGAFFAFLQSSENDEFRDLFYMGNGIDNDACWNGAHDKVATAISGAATELEISSSLFTSTIHVSGTATSVTTTTLTLSTAEWGTNVFANFYVEIVDGASAGMVSKISSNTGTELTFTAISGLSGTPQFRIRTSRFNDTGTLIVGSQEIAYTGYTSATKFAISGTYTVAQDAPVAQVVTEFPDNPKGNMMLMKDGYRLVASTMNSTIYRSRVFDLDNFTKSSTRTPGQGDIIDVVEGTGNLTGLVNWGKYFLAIKEDLVKPYYYTSYNQASGATDDNDVVASDSDDTRIAPLIGGSYPLGTFNVDNAIVSCITGRGFRLLESDSSGSGIATSQDFSQNISLVAKNFVSDKACGTQFLDEVWISTKTNDDSDNNDIVCVFNTKTGSWSLPRRGWAISSFFIKGKKLYGTSATKREVYEIKGSLDIDLGDGENYTTATSFTTGVLTNANSGKRSTSRYHYITGRMNTATELTIQRLFERNGAYRTETCRLSYALTPGIFTEEGNIPYIGSDELGAYPLGSIVPRDSDDFTDMLYFIAYIEWSAKTANGWQITISTDGNGQEYEIFEQGLEIEEAATLNKNYYVTPGN